VRSQLLSDSQQPCLGFGTGEHPRERSGSRRCARVMLATG
jgi:hypothetical protein